jgi:alkanesulfonate monooxygenase SsuD/methylene tetrahydromethanopterin reductase-like flavin-dependent oxidoreductase (luciferase family)
LGVVIGWSAEEFVALGVPFAGRGRRTAEYVAAIRTLWADDVASFSGEFTRFESVRVNPKPVRGRRIPVVVGATATGHLREWRPLVMAGTAYLPAAAVAERVAALAAQRRRHDRDLRDLSGPWRWPMAAPPCCQSSPGSA